jgi:hypothetical protein
LLNIEALLLLLLNEAPASPLPTIALTLPYKLKLVIYSAADDETSH